MFFFFGYGKRVEDIGAVSCTCPKCGTPAELRIIRDYHRGSLFFIPVMNITSGYFAVCPVCHASMILAKDKGDKVRKQPYGVVVDPHSDLKGQNPF